MDKCKTPGCKTELSGKNHPDVCPACQEAFSVAGQLVEGIRTVSAGIKQLRASALSPRAIRLLIADASGQSMGTVQRVLDGVAALEELYLKPRKS